jgi:hypothetical protein
MIVRNDVLSRWAGLVRRERRRTSRTVTPIISSGRTIAQAFAPPVLAGGDAAIASSVRSRP